MSRPVISDKTAPVQGKRYRQFLQAYIMEDLVIGTL